jgi:putative toxin-antitoxin system antitoxin component (TIGR02293 family)
MAVHGSTVAEYVIRVLGGTAVFTRQAAPTSAELHRGIKRGLPYRSFESLRERLGLSVAEAANILGLPPRTLARRRKTRRLDGQESDRLHGTVRIVAYAFSVLGNEQAVIIGCADPIEPWAARSSICLTPTSAHGRSKMFGRIEHGYWAAFGASPAPRTPRSTVERDATAAAGHHEGAPRSTRHDLVACRAERFANTDLTSILRTSWLSRWTSIRFLDPHETRDLPRLEDYPAPPGLARIGETG